MESGPKHFSKEKAQYKYSSGKVVTCQVITIES